MSDYQYDMVPSRFSLRQRALGVFLAAAIIASIAAWKPWHKPAPANNPASTPTVSQPGESEEEIVTIKKLPQDPFDAAKMSAAVKAWAKKQTGTIGVTVMDEKGKVLAEHNGNKEFLALSIYKLYTAYIGYQRIDDGTYVADQPYSNGWTRSKCLQEMIRLSDNVCAEKMWLELGLESQNNILKSYGLKHTSMALTTTTSRDAAVLLRRLLVAHDLKADSRNSLLASMKQQIHRDALPTGFSTQTVYDKVGFLNGAYHDVGIVKFDDKRRLIVAVMTKSGGTAPISQLGKALATAAKKP